MTTVLPKETPVNQLPVTQSINNTDYILTSSGDGLSLVRWGDITISLNQTDFSSTIDSISAAQVTNTTDTTSLSADYYSTLPEFQSVYTTVNNLSSGWGNLDTAFLVQQGFISNTQGNYTGSVTPLTDPLVIGFNNNYASNRLVNINNNSHITTNVNSAALQFSPGTYKISGNLISRSQNSQVTSQYMFAFYNALPTVGNDATYSATNLPAGVLYSSVSYNNSTNTHIMEGYVYFNSTSYGLLLYSNTDSITATNTGAGLNQALSVFGIIPAKGGVINITLVSTENVLNIAATNNAIGVVQN